MENCTVSQYESMLPNGEFKRMIRRNRIAMSGDYGKFVDCLYEDLDACLNDMQRAPDKRQNDGEDRLTEELIVQLHRQGYDATHDAASGGHVDVTVSLLGLTWIGEAKKDKEFLGGFQQLTTRYRPASGDPNHNAGGLIFYLVNTKNPRKKRDAWRDELRGAKLENYSDSECSRNPFAFYSQHDVEWSGLPFKLRHMVVALCHDPKDGAAESKAKRAQARAAKTAAAPRKVAAKKAPAKRDRPPAKTVNKPSSA